MVEKFDIERFLDKFITQNSKRYLKKSWKFLYQKLWKKGDPAPPPLFLLCIPPKTVSPAVCVSCFSVWAGFSSRSWSSSSSSNFVGWPPGLSRLKRSKSLLQNLWTHFLHVLCVTAPSSKVEKIISIASAAFFKNCNAKRMQGLRCSLSDVLFSLMIFEVTSARLPPIIVCFKA